MSNLLRCGLILTMLGSMSGCASTGLKQVFHDNFADYTAESSVPPLIMPANMKLPAADNYYDMPPLTESSQMAAPNLYPPGSRLAQQAAQREQEAVKHDVS